MHEQDGRLRGKAPYTVCYRNAASGEYAKAMVSTVLDTVPNINIEKE